MATIQIKRSSGGDPPGSNLEAGELAYTLGSSGTTPRRLFIGSGSANKIIGGEVFTEMLDHTAGQLTASSALIADASSKLDNLKLKGANNSTPGNIVLDSNDGTYSTTLTASNVGANRTLTLPNVTDTLVGKTTTDILTNKTLTTPIITEIDSGTTITLDATTDIVLDAGGGDVFFKDDGTTIATLSNTSSDFVITTGVQDKDFIVKGDDNGSTVTAMTLDMSDAGQAIFSSGVTTAGASSIQETLTVGENDTGYDVIFHGATSSANMTWDESADDLILNGAAGLIVPEGQLVLGSTAVGATAAELNLLDGVSGLVQADFTKLAAVDSTAAELNLLNGVSGLVQGDFTKLATVDSTAAELNLLNGVSGLVQGDFTKLAAVDSTATELNIVDGTTSIGTTAVADDHGIVMNHGGTMAQTTVQTLAAYLDDEITAMPNLVTTAATSVGALNSGSITSGFGTIDTGASTITTTGAITGGSLVADNITIDASTISSTDNNGNVVINPDGTGTVDMSNARITSVADPSGAQDAATKAYVDAVSIGLDVKDSVVAATTANLSGAYSNGSSGVGATLTNNGTQAAFSIDGVSPSQNDRVLVKNQTAVEHNGIYTLTTVGSGSANWVLTRAIDADAAAQITGGTFVFVEQGTTNADAGFVFTHNGTPTMGTTDLGVTQFSGAGAVAAGDGLTQDGNTFTVGVDDSSIEINSDVLRVAASGITNTMLAGLIDLTAKVTGTLPVGNGGVGLASHTAGDMLYASSTSALARVAKGTSGQFMTTNGTIPSWTSTIDGGTFGS
jgi:hypothetical protein